MTALLTPAEYKDYLRYMKLDEPEVTVAVEKPVSIYDLLEVGALEAIADYHQEISLFKGLMEHFDDDRKIRDYCVYLIELCKIFVQEEYENVFRWRKEKESA